MATDKTPSEVKAAIRDRGTTLTALAAQNGFSQGAVSIALRKRAPFVQQMIADFLGEKPQDIWPSRYDVNGSPVRIDPRGRTKINHPNEKNRQEKGRAA